MLTVNLEGFGDDLPCSSTFVMRKMPVARLWTPKRCMMTTQFFGVKLL